MLCIHYQAKCFVLRVTAILFFLLLGTTWGSAVDHFMKITLLGTGTPYPNGERFGSAIVIDADGKKLLFDCGRGAVIRLAQAGQAVNDIGPVFLTHLHSDHVTGLPDLWLTGWFLGRQEPLRVWGPTGTVAMARNLSEAFSFDIQTRVRTEHLPLQGSEIVAQDIEDGSVLNDGPIRVTAFAVHHGPVKPAFGYRVDYAEHSIVISGDTLFSDELVKRAKSVDCLIHAAWSAASTHPNPDSVHSIASAQEAAHVFAMTKPKLAVIYHYKSDEGMATAIGAEYKGAFVIAKDLMTIDIDHAVSWKNDASSGNVR
jgi:ribonuclease Z